MPLLDGLRNHEAVSGSVSHDVSHVEDIHTDRHVGNGHGNRRQKIVVVGLGMVAISFMLVCEERERKTA